MSTGTLIASLKDIAERVVPLLPYGDTGMKIAKAVADEMREVNETMTMTREQIVMLDDARNELERAVNEHAKRTAAKLGDG